MKIALGILAAITVGTIGFASFAFMSIAKSADTYMLNNFKENP